MQESARWESRLNVGSDVIDSQHKILFDLIKDLSNAIRAGASMRVVDVLLGVLRDYAFQHFTTEEEYFKTHEEYAEHCLQHYALIKSLNAFILDFRNNRRAGDKTPSAFLRDWLFEHIVRFDQPFFVHQTANGRLQEEPIEIDVFDVDMEKKRLHKRIPHNEVVDGDIHANLYNATKLRSGNAKIVDMSPGGLMLSSADGHEVDDLLIVGCSIGRNFKMKEKVMVKSVHDRMYGVQFLTPSSETVDFFTKLYGSVHLNRAKIE